VSSRIRGSGRAGARLGTIHVRARGSGIETDIETGGLFEFRDGKVIRWEDFGSKDKALEAVRLRDQAGPYLDRSSTGES